MIIFESILTTFKLSIVIWGSCVDWLETKIDQPSANFPSFFVYGLRKSVKHCRYTSILIDTLFQLKPIVTVTKECLQCFAYLVNSFEKKKLTKKSYVIAKIFISFNDHHWRQSLKESLVKLSS